MNNSHNYADFTGMNLTSDNEQQTHAYQIELRTTSDDLRQSSTELRIEHMLLDHNKYHVYCE